MGSVEFDLPGQALRDAAPERGKFPLLVRSHDAAGAGIERAGLEQYCQRAPNDGPCFLLPFLAQVEPRGAQVVRPDPRVKAVFAIAPYGAPWYYGSLPRLTVPLFVAVGEEDDVATYARDGLEVYRRAGSKAKYLLTLEGARHNPFVVCPPEARANPEDFERCWEPVWDKERLFDLARHFAAAFFQHHLKGDAQAGQYLEPHLPGFRPRARVGIHLEHER